jgi:hypothetical protein
MKLNAHRETQHQGEATMKLAFLPRTLTRTGARALWVLLGAALLTGCASLQQSGGPEPLQLTAPQRDALVLASDDLATDQAMAAAADEDARRALRNSYMANRLVLLDVSFLNYLRSLSADRRTLDSASEGTVLGLSVLGTVIETARAKENLAALVATVTGLKSNVDKNYFGNRAMDALAQTMVTRRKEVLARVVDNLAASTASYSLVSARSDLIDYYDAGTMDGALRAIHADASKRDETVTKKLEQDRLVSNTLENLSGQTLTSKVALTRALGAKTVTLEALTKAMQALGVPADKQPGTAEGAASLLQQFVRGARTTDHIDALGKVWRDAGLLPK